jgi:hypothetical protein
VVLYHQLTTGTEVQRRIAYVQSDNTFRVVFDTTNLKKGTYKAEVPVNGLGDSVTMRIIQLVDRSDEIEIRSLPEQPFSGTLKIAGTMKGNQNSGIQIEITGPEGERILGPQYISTNFQGYFSVDVPIAKTGMYEVSLTDTKGFIGTKSVSVTGTEVTGTPAMTETAPLVGDVPSAHAKASRTLPAYFEVKANSPAVNVYTSTHINWVMEYYDDRGVLHTVRDRGVLNPEAISVQKRGRSIYFKVYPYTYSDSGVVYLYGENAQSVSASLSVPAVFSSGSSSDSSPAATQKSPVPAFVGIVSLLIVILIRDI